LIIAETRTAGEYRVRAGEERLTFVVNPATERESDLRTPSVAPVSASRARGTGRAATGESQGEIASVLLLVALALLAVEWKYHHAGLRSV
jgi:hypothetical protein